jgi:itaconate CoA-transferase
VFAIQSDREWRAFCEGVLLQPSLVADKRFAQNVDRVANRPAIDSAIGGVLGSLTREETVQRLRNSRVAFGSVNRVEDLSTHAALRRMSVDTPAGPVSQIAPAVRATDKNVRVAADGRSVPVVPALNQHGDALREEFAT